MKLGPLGTAAHLVREAGPGWVARRAWMALSHRLGLDERRTPPLPWSARPLATWLRPDVPAQPDAFARWRATEAGVHWIGDARPAAADIGPGAVEAADRILRGEWPFFSGDWLSVGFPPQWHRHPLSGLDWDATRHWSAIGDASADDIKYLWEPARFTVVFTLGRAYARTGEPRYAEAFWRLVDDWIVANPPMRGAQWRCGQETALRLFAWCFGLHVCAGSAASTPERVAQLVVAVAWQAERIEAHLGYARSQKNNHALSEAIGLLTVGTLFPELARATHWRDLGARVLAEELSRQVYADGAFVQHATNYHRVMLHDVAWAVAIARPNGVRLAPSIEAALARGTRWLQVMMDPATGRAPNFGNNDGALLFPLSDCAYDDMRPTVRLALRVLGADNPLAPGPWDEMAAWFGAPPTSSPAAPESRAELPAAGHGIVLPNGGQVVLRGVDTWTMVRCARFVDRPAHADQLHVDVWWRGVNVACDAGTYRYSAPPPWDHALARSAVHNTVTLDGADQMQRVSRFLWTRWAQGDVEAHGVIDGAAWMRGRHDGYDARGLRHARTVVCLGEHVVVVDDLDVTSRAAASLRLQWLVDGDARFDAEGLATWATPAGDYALRVSCTGTGACSIVRGGSKDEPTRGWLSPTYGLKRPASSVVLAMQTRGAARFVTVLGPAAADSRVDHPRAMVRVLDHGRGINLHVAAGAAPILERCP